MVNSNIDLAVEKLRAIRLAADRMKERAEEIKELKEHQVLVSSCDRTADKRSSARRKNPVQASLKELEELEELLLQDTKKLVERYRQGINLINSLEVLSENGQINQKDTELCRQLMARRYIRGQKWEKIASEMNYSWRQVMRLHKKGLKALAESSILTNHPPT